MELLRQAPQIPPLLMEMEVIRMARPSSAGKIPELMQEAYRKLELFED